MSTPSRIYGMCLSCGSVEVELFNVVRTRDLAPEGELPRYPTSYRCEVCS